MRGRQHFSKGRFKRRVLTRSILGGSFMVAHGHRTESVPMSERSQDGLDAVQNLNDVNSRFMKVLQHVKHAQAIKHIPLIEKYRNGNLALILDFVAIGKREGVRSAPGGHVNGVTVSNDFTTLLVLHNDSGCVKDLEQWRKQPVLIRNVA